MSYNSPCEDHTPFNWNCEDCKKNRRKLIYEQQKREKVYCKYCEKYVVKISFNKHKSSNTHQLKRKLAKAMA